MDELSVRGSMTDGAFAEVFLGLLVGHFGRF